LTAAVSTSSPPAAEVCQNCGATLSGDYCAQCGQRHHAGAPTLRHVLAEFADDYLHLDSKLPQTLWALLAKPGLLTVEFLAGRRARFVGPFKLYVLCSLLFFGVQALRANWGPTPAPGATQEKPIDFEAHAKSSDTSAFGRFIEGAVKAKLDHKRPSEVQKIVARAFSRYVPDGMLILLPLVALLFKLLNRRRYYAEHFVFALHLHSVGYLAFTLMELVESGFFALAVIGALGASVVIAFRRTYAQSWPRTLLKLAVVAGAYPLMLSFMIAAVMVAGLWIGS
jgi:hypothetical protein